MTDKKKPVLPKPEEQPTCSNVFLGLPKCPGYCLRERACND